MDIFCNLRKKKYCRKKKCIIWFSSVIFAVLEKKIYYRKIRIKTLKSEVCAVLEKKNIVAKENVFFGFLPLTNENKIKKH